MMNFAGLKKHVGFAYAVKDALTRLTTPYVMVVQVRFQKKNLHFYSRIFISYSRIFISYSRIFISYSRIFIS